MPCQPTSRKPILFYYAFRQKKGTHANDRSAKRLPFFCWAELLLREPSCHTRHGRLEAARCLDHFNSVAWSLQCISECLRLHKFMPGRCPLPSQTVGGHPQRPQHDFNSVAAACSNSKSAAQRPVLRRCLRAATSPNCMCLRSRRCTKAARTGPTRYSRWWNLPRRSGGPKVRVANAACGFFGRVIIADLRIKRLCEN